MWFTKSGLTTPSTYAHVPDGYDCFRELIQELRREHFDEVAGKIDLLLNHVAWTTGSELTGELGAAIRDFERAQPAVSPSLRSTLDACMRIVLRVWPDFPR
jgi:hypothetical protein